MAKFLAVYALLAVLASPAFACKWTWDPPSTNVDGTPLTDLVGYNIYRDGVKLNKTLLPTNTYNSGVACKPGTHWVTAVNIFGVQSKPSNKVVIGEPKPAASLNYTE